MRQIQNSRLYIRSSSQKNKTEEWKRLQSTSLWYFIAKSAVQVQLIVNKLEKTKHENFNFVNLFWVSSMTCIIRKLYGVCEWQITALLLSDFWNSFSGLGHCTSYGHKQSCNMQDVLVLQLLWLLFTYSGCDAHIRRPHPDCWMCALPVTSLPTYILNVASRVSEAPCTNLGYITSLINILTN